MRTFLLYIFTCFVFNLNAQEISDQLLDQIENFIEEQEEDVDLINLFDRLKILSEHPLDLNKADIEDLMELRLLTSLQINDLIDHIVKYGELISLEELQSIPSFQIEDIIRLRNFVQVNANNKFQMSIPKMFLESQNTLYLKWSKILEEKKGYIKNSDGESKYLGDENRVLLRFRNNFENRLRLGLTLEKDPGERIFESSENAGFDYLSFHGYLKDYTRTLKDLAIGDFSISLGQGLIEHNSFGSGKGALTTEIIRGGRVIRPYSSVNENGFLRGIGTTLRLHDNIEWTVFLSRVKRDGNIQTDTIDQLDPDLLFSSLQTSGNHRTASELEDRKSIDLTTGGTSVKYKTRKGHLAFNALHNQFDRELIRGELLYNKYRFEGKSLTNLSLDYNYRFRNFNFFGESAVALHQGSAHMLGAMVGLHRNLSLAVHARNYAKDYNALIPNAFGESTTSNNERGIYLGMEWQISKEWKFRSYADFWRHPWLKFQISRPSSGSEYFVRIDYYKKRKLLTYLQFIHEKKFRDYIIDGSATTQTGIQNRYKARIHLNNNLTPYLELRSRIEYTLFTNQIKRSKGYLIYQDIIFKSTSSPISFTSRFAIFDTDDFDSRIFAFENSVLYEFSIPAYFDQGFRYYFNMRYAVTRNMDIELRYAKTHLTNRESFSSGNELIDGDIRSEVTVQMKYEF